MDRRFRQVDVFTAEPYRGNPVAVVLDGEGLSDEEMRRFARWTNLSETTFVLSPSTPEADYRVRIFTPGGELPFAGHPTLGTCHAWLEAGGRAVTADGAPRDVVQECGAGLVRVRRHGARLAFAAPPLVRSGPVEEEMIGRLAEVLRIERGEILDAQWVDNGPGWVAALLDSAEAVRAVRPGPVGDLFVGVAGLYPPGASEALEVRAFFPANGVTVEDPVTGSLNASLAPWLVGTGRLRFPYVVSQGAALGRAGRVHLSLEHEGGTTVVWVSGAAVTCVRGDVAL